MMPFSCAASSASAICTPIFSPSSSGTAPSLAMRSRSVSPGTSSMIRKMDAVRLFQPMDCGDVGMIQRSQHLGFALKAGKPLGIVREGFWENFDRYIAPEFCVVRLVDFSHAARTNRRSEERRVGKECRARWVAEASTQKVD